MRRIWFLAQAEVLHIVRDRATLAQVLVVPIVQLLVLSNAATFAIRDTPTWVVDLDRTADVARAGQPARGVGALPRRRHARRRSPPPNDALLPATPRWSW